jgi:hypothetical protein
MIFRKKCGKQDVAASEKRAARFGQPLKFKYIREVLGT